MILSTDLLLYGMNHPGFSVFSSSEVFFSTADYSCHLPFSSISVFSFRKEQPVLQGRAPGFAYLVGIAFPLSLSFLFQLSLGVFVCSGF